MDHRTDSPSALLFLRLFQTVGTTGSALCCHSISCNQTCVKGNSVTPLEPVRSLFDLHSEGFANSVACPFPGRTGEIIIMHQGRLTRIIRTLLVSSACSLIAIHRYRANRA